ncbi:MAG TPA: long-chain fatty acid--CoA ligase [Comamonadaceae bacterium]|uniref:AMP-binding protein n=1 Tax=Pulveribacter sp. TaxID=2678893 RepID=UPI000ECF8FBE|nr:AMP-binding protein [Pulveribacter sp.]HCL85148.1 long-chain fatty acid--CoA ligase [Comamonadaceae bacterium]
MLTPHESATIGGVLQEAAAAFGDRPLLVAPPNLTRAYDPEGRTITYAQAADTVQKLMALYRQAGYGQGHRIALLLENRLEHMLHKLAMNALGICCVPVNPDYRPRELAYLIDHAHVDLVVVLQSRQADWQAGAREATLQPPAVLFERFDTGLPPAPIPATDWTPEADTPASILYTSGTTGRPKGCVLSHRYELAAGAYYATRGGLVDFRPEGERIYNPLPLFHVNASILSFQAALLTGSCQIQTDRFQPTRWWQEVRETRATIVHYLGVIVQMLCVQPPSPADRDHCVRFGMGAGVEPQLHAAFEERFGFPLLELWGMTENVRILVDSHPPRQVGTRAFGRSTPGIEVRVADDAGRDVPDGTPGEMLIRHSAATPRKDFFSGYLDDEAATEAAWRGGWFHTGDVVTRDATGMLHFVERRKNIIRRSGENIAAAEVEAWLLTHPDVELAAVMAVPDDIREEEVLACIVLKPHARQAQDREPLLRSLFAHCEAGLAYFKTPGWVWFSDQIPTTGTQKIQKHSIFGAGVDPRTLPGMHDLRAWKKRKK